MGKQDFNPKNIQRLVNINDCHKFGSMAGSAKTAKDIYYKLKRHGYRLTKFAERLYKGKTIYEPQDLYSTLPLRKLADNISSVYKLKPQNRDTIIKQMLVLFTEQIPKEVIRIDISSFYDSVDRNQLTDKLNSDSLLNQRSKQLLNNIFNSNQFKSTGGLPRGLCISAPLAELYMRGIDAEIATYTGVYYYARYVDDIIVIAYENAEKIKGQILECLAKYGLSVSKKPEKRLRVVKLYDLDKFEMQSFEYLGYKFVFNASGNGNKKRKFLNVSVRLSDKKVTQYKTRIVRSFLDYLKTKDFVLLKNRIRFLAGNHLMRNKSKDALKIGIYYSYPGLSEYGYGLHELDWFLKKNIFAKKGNYGKRIAKALNARQKKMLAKYSFVSAFKHKRIERFSPDDLSSIMHCWRP